jgi:hypothetical protein
MDGPRYVNQDGYGLRNSIIIMDTDERATQQPHRRDGRACRRKRLENRLCPPYEPAISYTKRAAMPRSWLRRSTFGTMGYLSILLIALFALPTSAVFVSFDNCLPDSVQEDALELQFVPLFVDAKFNTTDPNYPLQVTVWGNVTGSGTVEKNVLPPPNDPYWANASDASLGGKIQNYPPTNQNPTHKITTLSLKADVLTYEAWSDAVDFCDSLVNATCALGPSFFANAFVSTPLSLGV